MELLKIILHTFINPKKAVREINVLDNKLIGIFVGIIGSASFPVSSNIFAMIIKHPNGTGIDILNMLRAAAFYFISVILLYFICKLFKGSANLYTFISGMGWTWIYLLYISFVMLVIGYLMTFKTDSGEFQNTMPIIYLCLFIIYIAFSGIFMVYQTISKTMLLNRIKTISIMVLTLIPLFFLYDVVV